MLWNKEAIRVKGYALVYTMLVGLIIIMLVGFEFSVEVKRKINIEKYENNVEENQCSRETKEYLFAKMNNLIFSNALSVINHNSNLNRGEVKIILLSLGENNKIGCNNCCIFYDKPTDKIVIRNIYENGKIRDCIYEYDVMEEKIKYVLLIVRS